MPFLLLLDEDVPILLAQVLRQRGYDVFHATEAGLSDASDERVFAFALEGARALLTHNVADFLALTDRYAEEGRAHAGLFLTPQIPFAELLRRTLRAFRDRKAEDLVSAVVWLT